MQVGPPRPRRPRPVADAPVEALLRRTEDLTKGWLLTLLECAPLVEAPGILAADLPRDGPRLCDAVVRALAEEAGLDRIGPDGALEVLASRAGELVGARGAGGTARAVETLRAVVWSALVEELPRPDPELVAALAERLALVIDRVRGAALRRSEGAIGPATEVGARTAPEPVETSPGLGALWVGALEDEIARAEGLSSSLSLLLVELDEVERVVAVEPPSEADAALERFIEAFRSVVRRQDVLACETEARTWIIVRDTGRAGARALASRIARSVRAAKPWRGAPMTASIGLAVLGEDGCDSAALIEAAEESRYAAAASGREIAHEGPPAGGGEPPHEPGPRLVR